jgi:lipooligosaccharide transport system permease protein
MAAFGTVLSPFALAALPVAVLTGVAFAAPIAAFSATQTNDVGFSTLYRIVLVPLFLFSGTFFPVDRLPGWLQPVADATPLEHGVALCRALVLGHPGGWAAAGDAGYLLALAALGTVAAHFTYRRRLVT